MTSEVVDEFPVTNKQKKDSSGGGTGSASMSPWQMYGDFFHQLFGGGSTGPQRTYPLQAGGQDVNSMPGAPDRAPPVMAGQAPPLPPQAPPQPPLQADPVTGAEPLLQANEQMAPYVPPGQQDNQSPQAPNPMLSMMMAMGRDGLVSAPAQAGQAPLDVNADTTVNKTSRPPPKKVKKAKAAKGDWTAHIED